MSSFESLEKNSFSEIELIEDSQPQQIKYDDEISIVTSYPQNRGRQNLPIKIQVEYKRGILGLKIDCEKVKRSDYAYIRHYLVFDLKEEGSQQKMCEIRNQYFNQVQKGDLIMTRGYLGGEKVSGQKWIQKTMKSTYGINRTNKMEKVDNLNAIELLEQVYQQSKHYKDLIIVSLFVDYQPTKSFVESIKNSIILKNNKASQLMKLFILTQQQKPKSELSLGIDYIELKASNMFETFKLQIQQFSKIKLSKLFIQLSTNGHLHQKRNPTSNFVPSWSSHSSKLTKQIHQIKDNTISQQLTLMRPSQSQTLQLFISITFFSLIGDKFISLGCVQILPINQNYNRSYVRQSFEQKHRFKKNMTATNNNYFYSNQESDFDDIYV